jgi:hypothetical protein
MRNIGDSTERPIKDKGLANAIIRRNNTINKKADENSIDIQAALSRLDKEGLLAAKENTAASSIIPFGMSWLLQYFVSLQVAALALMVSGVGLLYLYNQKSDTQPKYIKEADTLRGGADGFNIRLDSGDPEKTEAEWESDLIGSGASYTVIRCQSECYYIITIQPSKTIINLSEEHHKILETWKNDQPAILQILHKKAE